MTSGPPLGKARSEFIDFLLFFFNLLGNVWLETAQEIQVQTWTCAIKTRQNRQEEYITCLKNRPAL